MESFVFQRDFVKQRPHKMTDCHLQAEIFIMRCLLPTLPRRKSDLGPADFNYIHTLVKFERELERRAK